MIRIKSPGRICLFGEHQDYLGYPVISLAISKYIILEAKKITKPVLLIHLPDKGTEMKIELNGKELGYESKREYIKSGYNHFIRKGIKFSRGYDVKIRGTIPINAGVGSSSALVIAWLYFLSIIGNLDQNLSDLAYQGYLTEVKEFQEAGGMMDHYTSAFGNLLYLKQEPSEPLFYNYDLLLDGFILGNSMENKNTVDDLRKVKKISIESFLKLSKVFPEFDQFESKLQDITPYLPSLEKRYREKILANLNNRNITSRAKLLIDSYYNKKCSQNDFYTDLGSLLNQHHHYLEKYLGISTRKIEDMIHTSRNAGALGAKINGSGFGGTMFALAQGNEEKIASLLIKRGYEADIVKTSKGVSSS